MPDLLHQLLERSADESPELLAIVDGDRRWTYESLDAYSNRIANLLIEHGVSKGDRVGIHARKSLECVAAAYGVMKAGAAYVPLDPDAPAARVGYIIGNCGIRHVVTEADKVEVLSEIAATNPLLESAIVVDREPETASEDLHVATPAAIAGQPASRPSVRSIDLDLAVILYTSGSTGNPKGVMLSHVNVMTFVEWAAQEFQLDNRDRLSQIAPLHFDLSTFDIFGAALAGASVHLAPKKATVFPIEMSRFLESSAISVVYAVPSILTMLTERAKLERGSLPSLRTVLFAGEVFPTKYLSRIMNLLPHAEFANLYGPTETNVCTYFRVREAPPEDAPPISIGRAIANVETIVVREDGTIADRGEVGELYVRGATVMVGYWGDPERTAESRIEFPLRDGMTDVVYRTGDLVVEQDDGTYTFLGRRDNQIKSRGYRIELGDIESAMYGHSGVQECAAVAIPDDQITNRIKAYVVLDSGVDPKDLSRFVAELVPPYMVPSEFEERRHLPKTSTGKIDRQALLTDATPGT